MSLYLLRLYYYGARYYDPILARFISPDTIVPDPTDPQSLNRYSYVLNNPLRYIDPTGNWYDDSDPGLWGIPTYYDDSESYLGSSNLFEFISGSDNPSKYYFPETIAGSVGVAMGTNKPSEKKEVTQQEGKFPYDQKSPEIGINPFGLPCVVLLSFWVNCLADQPGQKGDDDSLRVGIELLPEGQFFGRSFRFGPKGELAWHVLSPPWKGFGLLAPKNRSYGEESQLLYGHGGGGKSTQAWLMGMACYRQVEFVRAWRESYPDRSMRQG